MKNIVNRSLDGIKEKGLGEIKVNVDTLNSKLSKSKQKLQLWDLNLSPSKTVMSLQPDKCC